MEYKIEKIVIKCLDMISWLILIIKFGYCKLTLLLPWIILQYIFIYIQHITTKLVK